MENNELNDLVLRDKATAAGLASDKAYYKNLEEEIGPLRDEHAANTTSMGPLAQAVLAADTDDATTQKAGARKLLKDLGERLAGAMQGIAASPSNTDEDLPGKVNFNRTDLIQADDATFASILHQLLDVSAPYAERLERREFTPEDRATTEKQLVRFERKQVRQRETIVTGSTDRKTLLALVNRNRDLIRQLRKQLKGYKNSATKHDVWQRFQGYTKIVAHRGGGGPKPEQ